MILYSYAFSSASYRVRIALALKNLSYNAEIKNLRAGEHCLADYLQINPQGFVPALKLDDGVILSQSVAIIEYLDELYPLPALLPSAPVARAHVRALTQVVSCDISPLNNMRVLKYLEDKLALDKTSRDAWYRHWIETGFDAIERWLQRDGSMGRFCYGNAPTLADICLVPQVFNARRFSVDLNAFPRIRAIDAACRALPAFQTAAPEAHRG